MENQDLTEEPPKAEKINVEELVNDEKTDNVEPEKDITEEPPKAEESNSEEFVSDEETDNVELDDFVTEKDEIIREILSLRRDNKEIKQRNRQLQHQLSLKSLEDVLQDKLNMALLPTHVNEDTFRKILENIDHKQKEIEEHTLATNEKLESIKSEMAQKEDQQKQMNEAFKATKLRTAMSSVNSEDGSQYVKEEVVELLEKEEKMRKILEQVQLEEIKTNYHLQIIAKEKKNLAVGFLDYGEYEVMCTSTENNAEVIKQLKDEIKKFTRKSSKAVNVLSHLLQKLQAVQHLVGLEEEKEKQLEGELNEKKDELFKEKLEYTKMWGKNEELHHRHILLQYPRLLEDYKDTMVENKQAKQEIEQLKEIYFHTKKLISQ